MMMSLNSKQHFAMAHSSLPEPKYSLHSSSSSTLTSNVPSSSCSSSRHSSTIISSSGSSSSEAMRRACLPTPPVRILHNHCFKAHFDSPLFFFFFPPRLMFFSCLHSKSPSTSIFFFSSAQLMYSVGFAFRINFYDLGCCMCLVLCAPPFFFLGYLFFFSTFWKCFKPRSGGRIPC